MARLIRLPDLPGDPDLSLTQKFEVLATALADIHAAIQHGWPLHSDQDGTPLVLAPDHKEPE